MDPRGCPNGRYPQPPNVAMLDSNDLTYPWSLHLMTEPTPRIPRPGRFLTPVLVAMLALGMFGSASPVGASTMATDANSTGITSLAAVALGAPTTPMVLQNVSLEDLVANRAGICNGGFNIVMKNASSLNNARNYLNAAQTCGVKVIFFFPNTANHSTGRVYPANVAAWVKVVKDHPALFGYLSVKEPSWSRISAVEIRSLYSAFHKADPNHPVVAIFGDIPHFNGHANPWTGRMADILIVDWYPIETARNGCSRTGLDLLTSGPKYLRNVRKAVALETPGTPIWLMVQTHKYLAPACHKKQRPTETQLRKQVRDGFVSLGAKGIAFHTFQNTSYASDERRDPAMVRYMRTIADQVHAGTFN